ncbi:tetratricopeptide repeat protein [Silvibacterium sp.]|uniref:tetratricopeptide repeat protein n=1 Tax=Silvibacterium sp. TaxID=1964179 RepID=UPI0039E633A6
MFKRTALLFLSLVVPSAFAASSQSWTEVRSPHFTVLTDAGEKRGRQLLDQFERMRWVFQALHPKANVDPVSPILVVAVKNQKEFAVLEPEAYLNKGSLALAGYFLRAPEKNYIALRLDAEGEHPYATVYHEYTHLQLGNAIEWMPLWLNEGMAEFFQNTDIIGKDVRLGEPSVDDILYLRQNRLIPLTTLLKIDANSPYYHEEQKGSIFYSESWALTHYLEITDRKNNTHRLRDYLELVSQHTDSLEAAQKAFGDLKQLQSQLDGYVSGANFSYFVLSTAAAPIDPAAFTAKPVSDAQAEAVEADFLADNGRTLDARAMIGTVLHDEPDNVQAHETMGDLELRDGRTGEARKWYEQAVKLDSQSYLTNYYYATMLLYSSNEADEDQVESCLKAAIKLNPRFAPAYDLLASSYARRQKNLSEAHIMNVNAVALEPGNLNYRINAANVLMEAQNPGSAIQVLEAAEAVAKTPQESAMLQIRISQIKQQEAAMQANQQRIESRTIAGNTGPLPSDAIPDGATVTAPDGKVATRLSSVSNFGEGGRTVVISDAPKHPSVEAAGPWHTAKGVISAVKCSDPAVLEFTLSAAGKQLSVYNNNYYRIEYAATNFTPEGDIHPCKDLEGMKANIRYSKIASDKTTDGQVVSIELSR